MLTSSLTTVGTIGTGVWNGTPVTVAYGGTGDSTLTAYAVMCGGATPTGALQQVSGLGLSGQVLTSAGPAALPTWTTVTGTGSVTSITAGTGLTGGTITTSGTVALSVPVSVANGGTGDTTLTAYAILAGGITSTGALQQVSGLGLSGQVLTSAGAGALPTWTTVTGTGSVTSVALTAPGVLYSVSGSPVTTSGTLALALITQSANTVLAGPTTGAAATPTMRALVVADLPTTGLTITQSIATAIVPSGTSGTITLNLALGNWFIPAQCTAAFTLALSNPTVGQTFRMILQQAASGGPFAVTWFAGITWIGSPYTAPTMPATASAYLEAIIECIGSGVYLGHWIGNSAA